MNCNMLKNMLKFKKKGNYYNLDSKRQRSSTWKKAESWFRMKRYSFIGYLLYSGKIEGIFLYTLTGFQSCEVANTIILNLEVRKQRLREIK